MDSKPGMHCSVLFLTMVILGMTISWPTYPSIRFFFFFSVLIFNNKKLFHRDHMTEEQLEMKILTKSLYINYRNGDSILKIMVGDALKF